MPEDRLHADLAEGQCIAAALSPIQSSDGSHRPCSFFERYSSLFTVMRIFIVQPSYSQPDDVFFFIKTCTAFRRVAADVKRQASLFSYTTVKNYVKKLEASRLLFQARSAGRTVLSPVAV